MVTSVAIDLEEISHVIQRELAHHSCEAVEKAKQVQLDGGCEIFIGRLNEAQMLNLGIVLPQARTLRLSIMIMSAADDSNGVDWTGKDCPLETCPRAHYYVLGLNVGFMEACSARKAFGSEPMSAVFSKQSFEVPLGDYRKFRVGPGGTLALLIVEEV